jgi:hypothetical protein
VVQALGKRRLTGDQGTRWTLRTLLSVRMSLMTVMVLDDLVVLKEANDVSSGVSSRVYAIDDARGLVSHASRDSRRNQPEGEKSEAPRVTRRKENPAL